MNDIHFEQAGLGSVLIRNQLVLPPNQREYSWETHHVKQLLEDFAKAISDNGKEYFLGTLVTIPRADGVLEVVDGQQRLATTSITLAAIRDYLVDKDNVIVEAIENKYLSGFDMARRIKVPKLRLNLDDNELFAAIVTRATDRPPVTKASHRKLMDAYDTAMRHVQKIVAPHDKKNHADVLVKWVAFIEHRALAILVRVADGANAYKMFETLNDRGLKTTQADLIKSFLFEKAGSRQPEVQVRWSSMRGALEALGEKDQTVTFLRQALIVQCGQVRESAVYETVQSMAKNEDDAVATATNLENLANSYVATFNPEHEKWNGYADAVRRSIVVFNLLATRPLRPLMLAIAAKFDKKETALAFQFFVSLSARLTISGGTTSGSIDDTGAACAVDIFTGKIKTTTALKKALIDITPTDERFKEATAVAKVAQPKFARYYLRSLEMAAKPVAEPYFIPIEDPATINLEHVLPKKPIGNWPKFSDEEADLWVNRLGNQMLMRVSDNSNAKSGGFAAKKPLYAKSPYELTKQVAAFSDWTTSAIEKRQRALAELAVKTWPI
jgi:Protein of unknown function DUF262/Protein of unknown function (DUF1524)